MIQGDNITVNLSESFRHSESEWALGGIKREWGDVDVSVTFKAKVADREKDWPYHYLGQKDVSVTLVLDKEQYKSLVRTVIEDFFFESKEEKLKAMIEQLEKEYGE